MKHPVPEEWLAYHYGEIADPERAALREHLESCADCRARVAEFQQTLGALDDWKLPAQRPRRAVRTAWRWAAAAVIALCVGFVLGRANGSREVAALRTEMKQSRVDANADAARA